MTGLYVGVDPGKTGGIVVLNSIGAYVAHRTMPIVGVGTRRSRPSLGLLLDWWRGYVLGSSNRQALVAVERVSSMPSDGVKSAYSFGRSVQVITDFAEALRIPMTEISPKDWQKVWLRGHPKGTRDQIKASAALVAGERFPELVEPLQVKKNWGLADAALIGATARLIETADMRASAKH